MNRLELIGILLFFGLITLPVAPLAAEEGSSATTVEHLRSDAPRKKRDQAVDELIKNGKQSVPALLNALKSEDEQQRHTAMQLLSILKSKEAVGPLLEILKNSASAQERQVAVHALGKIQDKTASALLADTINNPTASMDDRYSAIIALGNLKDKKAVPVLISELGSYDERLRIYAAGSLGLLNHTEGYDVAIAGTYSSDSVNRLHAVQALGLIGKKDATTRLNELLADETAIVMKRAITLSHLQITINNSAESDRIKLIKDAIISNPKNGSLLSWGMMELVEIGSPDAIKAIKELKDTIGDGKSSFVNRYIDIHKARKGGQQ